MAENTEISYIKIPQEVSLIVPMYSNLDDAREALLSNHKITCIILYGDTERSQDAIDKMNYIKENMDIKTAWFCFRKSLPFKSEYFNYIRTEDSLYMNVGDASSNRYIDISKFVETKDKLNPLDPYYFEKFDELKN